MHTRIGLIRLGAAAFAATAIVVVTTAATFGFGSPPPNAQAQAASCSSATVSAPGDGRFAIVDVGNGIASFVCIGTSGGQRAPISRNGRTTDNCFSVDGLGTAVVRVFKTDPAILPNCPDLIRIDVGVTTPTGVTPTATATSTAATPTTATSPTATPTTAASPTATATLSAPTATPTAALPPPTATPAARPQAPLPPATGSGSPATGSGGVLQVAIALLGLTAGAGGGLMLARRGARS